MRPPSRSKNKVSASLSQGKELCNNEKATRCLTMGKEKAKNKKENDNALRRKTERWLWGEIGQEIFPLTIGSFAMIVSSYSNQAVPRLMGRLMDPMSVKTEGKSTPSFAASIVCLGFVGGAASFIRTTALSHAQDNLAGRLRKQAFEVLLTQRDFEWFDVASAAKSHTTGNGKCSRSHDKNLMSGITDEDVNTSSTMTPAEIGVILKDDVDLVAHSITGSLANLLRSLSSCVFGTYNMLCLNPSLLGLSLVVAPVVGTVAWSTRKYLKKVSAVQHQAALNAAAFLDERLNHVMMVKMSNREKDEVEKYNAIQDQYIESGKKSAIANGLSMGSMFALSSTALCGILLVGGRAVESKRMTHGELVSFGSYSFLLALGSAGVVKALTDVMKGMQSADRLYLLFSSGSENEKQESTSKSPQATRIIESPIGVEAIETFSTENLFFSYRVNPSAIVLRNVSLSVSRGEVIAIVGKNGAGKSTIASLFAGLYNPTSGDISVYSRSPENTLVKASYSQFDRKTFSKLVQVVPQDPALFDTSILENVRYSCPQAPDDSVIKALSAANCDEFIAKLEGGIHYQVGRNGSRLSGGQRQRLGLARALLSDPVLLVLDEPASSLDAEGGVAVSTAISACRMSKKALLLITHSAKTLASADRAVVLSGGSVVQEGALPALKAEKNSLLMKLFPDL